MELPLKLSIQVLVLLSMVTLEANARWQSEITGDSPHPVAFTFNESGERTAVYRDENERVYLQFELGEGFMRFSRHQCPTFQIDKRRPMHHFEADQQCQVNERQVRIYLGEISGAKITSLVLHRFMNGQTVAFRYATQDGGYHQSHFALGASKSALLKAIGFNTQVIPK